MEGHAWQAGRMLLRALRAGRLGFCLVCFGHTLPGHAKVLLTRLVWPLLSSLPPAGVQIVHTLLFLGLVEESDKSQVCGPGMEINCC
jgi:hypothetical protein